MRVLLVSPLPPPSGGMARWTQLFLEACSKADISVSLVNTSISEQRSKNEKRDFSLIDEINRSKRIVKEVKEATKKDNPSVVHLCSSCSRYGLIRDYLCVKAIKEKPLIFHCHCNISDQARTRFSKWILKRIVLKCKNVIVLNSFSKKTIDDISAKKALVIPNFVEDIDELKKHAVAQHISKVVFVGHVKKSKGIRELFQTAVTLKDITFNVVGPIQELPEDIDVPQNVQLIGEVKQEDVSQYLAEADVFVFPSHTEGFANVMLEAMLAGLPIVATDVGANRDMIENRGGIIVPVNDYRSLVKAINELDGYETRIAISNWNQEKVLTQYTQSTVVPKIIKCYEEL